MSTTSPAVLDRRLYARFRDGDPSALETMYWAHVDDVIRCARAVLRNAAAGTVGRADDVASELADVVQEAFAKAFAPETRRRFDGEQLFGPYLLQIARNVAVDHWRARRRQVPVDVGQLAQHLSLEAEARERDRAAWADAGVAAVVERYIASLDPEERRVHEALYLRGLSQRDAAAELGIGRQVIRTVEARVRAGLRCELARFGYLDGDHPTGRAVAPAAIFPRRV